MIDMHCHILPGVDDGSKDLETSLQMAKRAVECGYKEIFATSHYIDESYGVPKERILLEVDNLNKALKDSNIQLIIHPGNEVYFRPDILGLINSNIISTYGGTKYVLVEFPMKGEILGALDEFNKLLQIGYVPVLAHPERYEFVQDDYKKLLPFIYDGVLLQSNLTSITGRYGKSAQKTVKKLLKANMIHLIGTDAHTVNGYDNAEKAMKKISKIVGVKRYMQIIYDNPKAVLADEEVSVWSPSVKNKLF